MSHLPAVPEDDFPSALEAAGAVIDSTSLRLSNPDLPWDDYERLGAFLGQMNRACAWWVGDLIIYGEEFYGHYHAQVEQALGLAPQTVANRASVARHIPPSKRRASLPFGVHAEVAYLKPEDRDRWLDRAELGGWTRARLREEMGRGRGTTSGLVDDLIATGKSDAGAEAHGGASAAGREEHPDSGVPAASGDFLGEPVLGPIHTCPSCGHSFLESED